MQTQTLKLRRPFGRKFALTLLFLVVYLAAGEVLIRVADSSMTPGTPSLGSEHKQFEQQWFRLKRYALQRKSVDCIMLGDSTVMSDFSPQAFADSFRQQTGEEIDCFNFGVGAFTAVGMATLAQILVQEYSPRLLLIGVQALNFTVPGDAQGSANLSSTAWAQYRLGEFSAEGWLYEHSVLRCYLGVIRQLVTFSANRNEVMLSEAGEIGGATDGYFQVNGTGVFDVSQPPDLTLNHPYIEHYSAALADFNLWPENLAGLETILSLDSATTHVILVEMPVTETFHRFFGKGPQDYRLFVDTMAQRTAAHHIPLWRMQELERLPSQVWYNYNHLNADGAPIFSRWLGEKLAQVPGTALSEKP